MQLTATQWKKDLYGTFSMAGGMIMPRVSGADYGIVYQTASSCGIPVNRSFIEKLNYFEHEVLKLLATGDGGCTPEKKESCAAIYGEFLEWTCKNCKEKTE